MTNWRDIDTSTPDGSRALDVEIAKRFGWSVREYGGFWRPYAPDGKSRRGVADTEALGWEVAFKAWWRDPPLIPEYTTDLNAAFALPIPTAANISLTHHPQAFDEDKRYSAIVEWFTPREDGTHELHTYSEWGTSPALVLCKAWLAWHDAVTAQPASD